MNIKNEVLYRVYFVLFGIVVPVACLLIYKTIDISYIKGEEWRQRGENLYVKYRPLEAERGNILTEDGSLLATSLPFFDIGFDPNSTGMKEEDFMDNLDSLSYCLATYVDNTFTVGGFREYLLEKRSEGTQFIQLAKNVSFLEKERISQFPLFNLGQFKGGFIAKQNFKRQHPFGMLAHRTIGYVREGANPVGIEGNFNEQLGGEEGQQLMFCVDREQDLWIPVEDLTEIEPKSGDDIVTTVDVNIQDVAQEALLKALNYHNADYGVVVVMEVNTGAIRAIANIGRTDEGWWETYNHAIGSATEPGSTFKLASMMALLEDKHVDLNDTISIEYGKTQFYEEEMVDATKQSFQIDSTSVRQVFEISSNVGIAKLVQQYYGSSGKAKNFIQRLKEFNLHLPTGIEIAGEASPYIKEAYSEEDSWSGTTLPWMSTGYELMITPLQLLTFYNAVANDGMMMKPYLVSEIQRFGKTIKEFRPTVIKRKIASAETITMVQSLLEGVVERGTAHKLKTDNYSFAAKTGTAQINYQRLETRTDVGGYQASFAGYFPAKNPKYSCIVVINHPREHGFYGGDVAGPVFRQIADRCFSTQADLHKPLNLHPKPILAQNKLPEFNAGYRDDMKGVLSSLNIPNSGEPATGWTVLRIENDSVMLKLRTVPEETVPSVVGMGLRDALYILENRGLKVEFRGLGKVKNQSIKPGTKIRGQSIRLTLG